jgi:hypothetical protein
MSGLAMAAAALVAAGSAGAQVCGGFPTTDGQGTIGGLMNFPAEFDQYGAEGSYNLAGPLAVNAGYIYTGKGGEHLNAFRGGAAFDISTFAGNFRSTVSICPSVRADYYTSRIGVTLWQVPVGLGVGARVPLGGPGTNLTLYVIPSLVWSHSHVEFENLPEFNDTDTDTNIGVRGGFDLNFGNVYLGVTSDWVDRPSFNGQKEAVVGVRAGIRF